MEITNSQIAKDDYLFVDEHCPSSSNNIYLCFLPTYPCLPFILVRERTGWIFRRIDQLTFGLSGHYRTPKEAIEMAIQYSNYRGEEKTIHFFDSLLTMLEFVNERKAQSAA